VWQFAISPRHPRIHRSTLGLEPVKQVTAWLLVIATTGVAAAGCSTAAQDRPRGLQIVSLSSRPNTVSGGDVLLRVDAGPSGSLAGITVALNDADVTAKFRATDGRQALVGFVDGLTEGTNTIEVRSGTSAAARLALENHPISGPIISGRHEQPFVCETDLFKLQGGGTLGAPIDALCSVAPRVDYVYRSVAAGELKRLPSPATRPDDVAVTKTLAGTEVPYIVRIETGTINRGIYQISMLHDPASEPPPDPWTRSAGWNGRLIYTFGGGCIGGWYRQGRSTGGVDDDVMLGQGYAVASSTLNVFGNNCSDLLAAETMMMVKERFIEAYGPPRYTIGWGCSGGSYQNYQIADNYPGLLDGIVPGCSFPDVAFGTIPMITDARLLNHYFAQTAPGSFTDEQQRAVTGFLNLATMRNVSRSAGRIVPTEFCPEVLRIELRYDALTNPRGARCDVYDHTVNVYGRDPEHGVARRPLDNVGVQYGLSALNDGKITSTQFLALNERIGGYDRDGAMVAARTVADRAAVRLAYETGRLLNGGGGLASTPIIDIRGYSDDAKDGDVHVRYHSFSIRERLRKANGRVDNHIMLVTDNRYGLYSTRNPVVQEALRQMDRWLENLSSDSAHDAAIDRIARAKPADLVDACWTRDKEPRKIVEPMVRGAGRCEELYPSAPSPREVAGAPVTSDIIKCQLKPVSATEYKVSFTTEELGRLKKIFPAGVCDWSKPALEQTGLKGTWLRFGST
jgi:hypothetical protein